MVLSATAAAPKLPEPRLPEDLKDDHRDVSDLWKEALKAYKGIVGFDLERKFDDVQSMIEHGTKEMSKFHRFRHNEKKVDKLRTLFATNLDYLEAGAQQLISAAVPAFPPAAAIGTALTYLLGACRQVSADYDIVVVFFEDMNSFLQRIVILETRLPKYKAYQNCLMDVFTSFLKMCGFAHKYIELGRFKKWITNLMLGEDTDLGGARKEMDTTLARLQNATEFAILGNTEELQTMSLELQKNQHSHTEMLEEQKRVMNSIQDTAENIRDDMAKLLKAFDDQRKDRAKDLKAKPSTTDQNKPASARRIRNSIPEVEDEDHEYHILKETMVADTCSWVFSEPQWEDWLRDRDDARPLLAITGDQGTGKSHISATIYDELVKKAREDATMRTCATHFYFREQHQSLSSFISAISTVINQVVEQSAPLCEMINHEFLKDENDIDIWSWEELVQSLIVPVFRPDSKNHLFIVFDAIDELETSSDFNDFLQIIKDEELQIYIAFTTRPGDEDNYSQAIPVIDINVTKEKQLSDMKALIWNRLNTLNSLRKFGRYVQQRIADKVAEAAPNMLYAEHMLLHFNSLGREGSVLRNLDKPLPTDLQTLYGTLLEECHRRTASNYQALVTKLLHWVAFCFRPLSLDEVVSLLRYLTGDPNFEIEEIPEPFTKFIRVGDPGTDAEARAKIQAQGNSNTSVEELAKGEDLSRPELIYNDGALPIKFQERSIRSFFQEIPEESDGLRWKPSEAHRQIFLIAAELAQPTSPRDDIEIDSGLREYVTQYLIYHWVEIDSSEHSEAENAEVMQAFSTALSNQNKYATVLEDIGTDYDDDFSDDTFEKVSQWAQLLNSEDSKIRARLSDASVEWWTGLDENPHRCLLQVAKGHVQNLYTTLDVDKALTSFRAARKAIHIGRMNDIAVEKGKSNFPSSIGEIGENNRLNEKQTSLAMINLFDDLMMDSTAYFSVASVMLHYKRRRAAETTAKKGLELCVEPADRVRILDLIARIQLQLKKLNEAQKSTSDCMALLDSDGVTAELRRWATITKARIELERGETEAAATSYATARSMDPANLTPGDVLEEELEIFQDDQKSRHIETLKKWSPLERLTWMAWNYDDYGADRHAMLRDIAVETGEKDYVVEIYEEAIHYLDNVNAGAPLRLDLAEVYLQVHEDLNQSRKVIDEVLDSRSTGWSYAVTESTPEFTLDSAINSQTDVLARLFRQSSDPVVKRQLLEEASSLSTRPLALDVPSQSQTWVLQRQIVLARMYLKLGPSAEFQNILQGVIDTCLEALEDKVGWNDSKNLVCLASALTVLGKTIPNGEQLLRAADILFSARFCRLSPDARDDDSDDGDWSDVTASDDGNDDDGNDDDGNDDDGNDDDGNDDDGDDDDGDGGEGTDDGGEAEDDGDSQEGGDDGDDYDEYSEYDSDDSISSDEEEEGEGDAAQGNQDGNDEDKEEAPENEGDLDTWRNIETACNGKCNPATMFRWWGGRVGYECITCFGEFLCETCYEDRQKDNRGEEPLKARQYCGRNHEYLKGPIEGWKGIVDGKLMLEGEEPVAFDEFLRQVKEEMVKDAWKSFWEG